MAESPYMNPMQAFELKKLEEERDAFEEGMRQAMAAFTALVFQLGGKVELELELMAKADLMTLERAPKLGDETKATFRAWVTQREETAIPDELVAPPAAVDPEKYNDPAPT